MKIRRVLGISLVCICFLLLTGCTPASDFGLYGFNKIWYPIAVIWRWLWNEFTPNFWNFVERIWDDIPKGAGWLAGIFVNILGAILYVFILIVIVFGFILLSLVLAIVWFIVGLVYGFWHWDSSSNIAFNLEICLKTLLI